MALKEKLTGFVDCNIFVALLEDKCPLNGLSLVGHFHATTSGLFG
jgi:hypothetical protein